MTSSLSAAIRRPSARRVLAPACGAASSPTPTPSKVASSRVPPRARRHASVIAIL